MLDERELWKKISAGDAQAFDAWYRETAPRLRSFLCHLLGNLRTAEDVMQDTYTQIWRRPRGFDPERGTLRAWLYGIARKQAAEWWRKQKLTDPLEIENASPARAESSSVMADLLRQLPVEQRTEAAEFVSALCDGEMIPPSAAEHIGGCSSCKAQLNDYLGMGVELRRVASLEQSAPVPARIWAHPHNPIAAFLHKGWGTMRIPRLAFAAMMAGIVALACTLAVVKVGARSTGTVVLLTTTGASGALMDCPLSTLDKNQATCDWYGMIGSQNLAYRVRLLSRDDGRILLAIRTRTYTKGENLSSFTFDADSAAKVKEVWFEPGEKLRVDVGDMGSLTLTGEWMDHMPILMSLHGQDMSPGAGELRFASPLLLKDKSVAGDLAGALSGIFSTDDPNQAVWMYIPGQGSFLVSLLPMKDAVAADVFLSRISFQEGGHSWEFVTGAPVSRASRIWVLHQPDFKPTMGSGQSLDTAFISTQRLVQTTPGEWAPSIVPIRD